MNKKDAIRKLENLSGAINYLVVDFDAQDSDVADRLSEALELINSSIDIVNKEWLSFGETFRLKELMNK
ncbi:MAG: hypothetical protein R3213_06805 [Flavobacteriaceae bacterium]|nr:hypothetical protein [Flavobacteriaceae bacterium]